MSGKVLLALVIGLLLAGIGLALLVWLFWRLWTRAEREKEPAVVEFELEPQPADELGWSQEPERFSPAIEEVPPVFLRTDELEAMPPALTEAEVMPPTRGEPEFETWPMATEPTFTALGDDIAAAPVDLIVEEPAARVPQPGEADDLRLIEGIGPRIAGVLQEAGIKTFAHLAATNADQLQAILREADPRLLRLADPGTWPEQARLAAGGEWDELAGLQQSLRGGRRVR